MAAKQKKDTELVSGTVDTNQSSTITYANEVVAIIAGVAASEVEGIAGMCNIGGSGILNKNRNITRGVKVEIGTEEVSVDLYIIVEYGMPIQKAAHNAQENVRKAIESMTGLHVVRVDVHVQGVSFEKENSTGTLLTSAAQAVLTGADTEKPSDTEAAGTVSAAEKALADEAAPETEDEPAVEISFDDGEPDEIVEESAEEDLPEEAPEKADAFETDESAEAEVRNVFEEETDEKQASDKEILK